MTANRNLVRPAHSPQIPDALYSRAVHTRRLESRNVLSIGKAWPRDGIIRVEAFFAVSSGRDITLFVRGFYNEFDLGVVDVFR